MEFLEPTDKERELGTLIMACKLTLKVVRSPGIFRRAPTCVRAGP